MLPWFLAFRPQTILQLPPLTKDYASRLLQRHLGTESRRRLALKALEARGWHFASRCLFKMSISTS